MNGVSANTPPTDDTFTMWPSVPCRSRIGRNTWTPWITPHTLTSITQRQSSIESVSIGFHAMTPALLTTMSTCPNSAKVAAAKRSMSSRAPTSATVAMTS
jgi:hypothetical protein